MRFPPVTILIAATIHSLLRHTHQLFAEILTAEQADERLGGVRVCRLRSSRRSRADQSVKASRRRELSGATGQIVPGLALLPLDLGLCPTR